MQFNLVRLAMLRAGYTVHTHGPGYQVRELPEGEVDIVKVHPFRKDLAKAAEHIFLTDRDDVAIQASLDRFYDGPDDYKPIPVMREWLNKWAKCHPGTLIHYDIWEENPRYYAYLIVCELGLKTKVAPDDVLEDFQKISPPESGYDPKTFLFHNHVTSD